MEELKLLRRELLAIQGRLKVITRTVERLIAAEASGAKAAAHSGYDESAARVIERLNRLTGRAFSTRGTAGAQCVRAALEAGHTEAELIAVAESMTAAWKMNERMRPYLRPETLYGEHLESYIELSKEKVNPLAVLSGIEVAAALKFQGKEEINDGV